MAPILTRTLNLIQSPSARLLTVRRCSGRPKKEVVGKLVEIDLEEESTATSKADVEVLRVRRLEDAIHGIIVRRAAPDWLPFRPGSSYWVPPRPTSLGLVELVEKLANPMSEEERLSFSSVRGWPSLDYFVQGDPPHHVKKNIKAVIAQSDDDEG
ncbi:uncharacterized protein LOC120254465 [Dioscorea cayenensis subsp. rotundata]|uniref:Uncharacterized protein LOC120254465 n=1 Tax=Dioscorea cayennensis subsp. rotundata TaxID=55577 RepID=A0AB40AUL5_DIOCR|nr:uncharacterized protein LOC120254465 [Dioscorea cayenensis subsp. rotundata]